MEEFWILIFVSFFATNSLDKAVSVELEETPLQTFDELFVEEWWDKDEAEDLKTPAPTNFGQNVHHQIDRQNTQIGQFESNSTDQNPPLAVSDHYGQIEPNSTDQNLPLTEPDHYGQIEPNSTDQNLPLTEPDHYGQIEPNSTDQNLLLTEPNHYGQSEHNSTDQNPRLTESDHSDNDIGEKQNKITSNAEDERKRKIIDKFHAMKEELKQKEKYSKKEWVQIEEKIANRLKVNRSKIYKWKKGFGLNRKRHNFGNELKNLIDKFDQMKAELKQAGFKNSYPNQINETVAKELGLNFVTLYKWKRKLGQTAPQHKHSHNEQKELIKTYYEIKGKNSKIRDEDIAKMLKIGRHTLFRWKKQFKRQQLHPNSVDGHSVGQNVGSNVQEIGNSNSGNLE